MTSKQLEDNGYRYYKPTPLDGECVEALYQRSFGDDETYKKYFLTWKKWNFSRFADSVHQGLRRPRYEGNTQLEVADCGEVIELTFLSGWELDKAEKFMDQLYETGWFKPYER